MRNLSPQRIVVAMSGGVDSAVSAALLKEAGHEVLGISLKLYSHSGAGRAQGCCTPEDMRDARRVADLLEIPFYVLDYRDAFRKTVISRFCDEYVAGRTPNPCVYCNDTVKFDALAAEAQRLGSQYVATGHYARLGRDGDRVELLRSGDAAKDQTYFLFNLTQRQLAKALFPVGDLEKDRVREIAARLEMRVAEKAESQEICFVESGHYADVVQRHRPDAGAFEPGDFVDESGRAIGRHKGIGRYTIGQRKGLEIAMGKPVYVISIDKASNRVVIGPKEAIYSGGLIAAQPNFILPYKEWPNKGLTAKIRHSVEEHPLAETQLKDGKIEVRFAQPAPSVAPGQAVVFYDRERVLGGAWIERAQP